MNREIDFPCPLKGLLRDGIGAPGDVLEETGTERLAGQKIVAAVGRWAQDSALSGVGENVNHFNQQRDGECRAIGVEDARRLMSSSELHLESFQQALTKIGIPDFVKSDRIRQMVAEKSITAGRPECHRAREAGLRSRGKQIIGNVLQESCIKGGRLF